MAKEERDTTPTIKQKKAVDNLVENGGNISKAMRDAGYTDATAKNPTKLTESKGFEQLMDEVGLTDDFLLKALKNDIKKKKQNRKPELELAFKIKGKMTEKHEHSGTLIVQTVKYEDNPSLSIPTKKISTSVP